MQIVFDLDGTLVDSAPDIRAAANAALGELAPPLSLMETRAFVGSGAPIFVERMVAARDLPAAESQGLLQRFLEVYEGAVSLTELYPGVRTALNTVAESGHRLGLCTNKPVGPTRAVLTHLDLTGYFDVVIGGDSLPVKKPAPEPLWAAVKALGGGPAIYVGDSEVDAEAAERAGIPFVLFTEGYAHVPIDDMPHAAQFSDWSKFGEVLERVTGIEPVT